MGCRSQPNTTTREREREERNRKHERGMDRWTDETEGLKRLLEYAKKIGSFHGI
jgi:hypothetical protein